MSEQPANATTEKQQHLHALFTRLLPLIDSLADKLRLLLCLGILALVWVVVWSFYIKHLSITIAGVIALVTSLPLLLLARLWWALEELKNLPDIASQMLGDVKTELRVSVQETLRTGNFAKLSFWGAGKGLWSVSSLLGEVRELIGSYIGMSTLLNPFMLILALGALFWVLLLLLVSVVLLFFI